MYKNSSESKIYRFPASWEPKDAILLVWPDAEAISIADEIEELYEALISVLVDYADIIIATTAEQIEQIKNRLIRMEVCLDYVSFCESNHASINIGEIGPFIVEEGNQFIALATESNIFVPSLFEQKNLPCAELEKSKVHLSWKGVESDGQDVLLINLSEIRKTNSQLFPADIQEFFKIYSSQKNILVMNDELSSADLGLIRLSPDNQLLYLDCDNPSDSKYALFKQRSDSLNQLIEAHGNKLTLSGLPCENFKGEDGLEYLADYSQFIVINEAVLVPMYELPTDEDAMDIISQAYAGFDIFGFPSRILSPLKTGLFTITQTIPEGVQEPL